VFNIVSEIDDLQDIISAREKENAKLKEKIVAQKRAAEKLRKRLKEITV
jgi:predicted nuclease with TOPRIM domain